MANQYPLPEPAYAELFCLSNFSFLRGASHPEELVQRAHELGYHALAITDECSLAGAVRAHLAARDTGLRLILGSLLRPRDAPPLVLLACDREGYGNLSQLISRARRQADKGAYRLQRDDIAPLAGHCLAIQLQAGHDPDFARTADWLTRHFPGRAWLGVTRVLEAGELQYLEQVRARGHRAGLPVLAVGEVHMHHPDRRPLQDCLTAIRLGRALRDCGQALLPNAERCLRPRGRLARLYPPALLEETLRAAECCHFSLDALRYEYPEELVPTGQTPATHLRELTLQGMAWRWPQGAPGEVRARIEHELALIRELRYEPYFLTVHDIVRFARSRGILCQGRGSAANSAVCYCLGITEVDPARIDTLFERFISRERNEPPDIDVDFEHQRREEVVQYIYEKYGRKRAALAASVIHYRPRSALRDIGRALGLEAGLTERLSASLYPRIRPADPETGVREAGLDPDSPTIRQLLALTEELAGFPRHLSQHVGGFVIARHSLERMVPIENAAMPERTVLQWDKDDLDALGLLKIDCLSLGMLSAIRRALELVSRHEGRALTLADIPAGDTAVYEMISRADTVGVFQIESRAQRSMLPRLRPACFYDLVIEVAIVRPGPIQGDMVHPYLRRRQGLEAVDYPSPEVRGVLERTLGIPIFQEQVIRLAMVAAGFSAGEADQLRRAMATWRRHGEIMRFRQKLVAGMRRRGYSVDFAERIFRQIQGFGEYGFPESHAASFALLVYVSAWLKYHHPEAFTCALLNSQPMGFYNPRQLIDDLRHHGGEVRPVDVTASERENSLEVRPGRRPALRLGLCQVKGFSHTGAERLLAARAQRPFADVQDLARRARLDRGDLEALAAADALAGLAGHRHRAYWACAAREPLTPLLEPARIAEAVPLLRAPREGENILADHASLGLSLRRHPLELLRPRLEQAGLLPAAQLLQLDAGRRVRTGGLVTGRQSPSNASGVVFLTLEDETGTVQVTVWPKLAQHQRATLLHARLLAVDGTLQREGPVVHLLARALHDHSRLLGQLDIPSRDFH
ncbi:MAG TPA: error-prone DNA polymerase [Gammaproteobacteria bacterium]|nr:error-prone DNA polymerase [Gammaproteobacteria bacterium]